MSRRIAVAAVGIPAAFVLVYLGGWILAAVLAGLAGVGAAEIYRLAERNAVRALAPVGIAGAVAMPFALLGRLPYEWIVLLLAFWIIAVMASALRFRRPTDRPLEAVGVTVFGALYTGWMPAFLLWLRHSPAAPNAMAATWLVFLPLAVTWICDSLAMLGGSMIGGPKLSPVISPGKTWAGFITGGVGAVILAPLYGMLVLTRVGISIPLSALLLVGLSVALVGQVGDLGKSLFKREVSVKDSGTFFPGHGGVVDRLDSLYWVIPATAAVLRLYGFA